MAGGAAATRVRLHAIERRSRANGPGARFVVWFQGCTLGCPGCFNPTTHEDTGGRDTTVEAVLSELVANLAESPPITGFTLSGGEPLQQADAAAALLAGARGLGLSTLMFSGYTIEEARALPGGPEVIALLDVMIDGRYVSTDRAGTGLRGSSNQRIQLLTPRHSLAEIEATPVAEIRIGRTGEVVLTGINPLKLKR